MVFCCDFLRILGGQSILNVGIELKPNKIGEMVPRKLNCRNFREAIFFHANLSFQFMRVRKLQHLKVGGKNLVCFSTFIMGFLVGISVLVNTL